MYNYSTAAKQTSVSGSTQQTTSKSEIGSAFNSPAAVYSKSQTYSFCTYNAMGATGTPSAGSGSGSSGSTTSVGTTPPSAIVIPGAATTPPASSGSTGSVSTTPPTSSGGTTYSQYTLAGYYTSPPIMESNSRMAEELKHLGYGDIGIKDGYVTDIAKYKSIINEYQTNNRLNVTGEWNAQTADYIHFQYTRAIATDPPTPMLGSNYYVAEINEIAKSKGARVAFDKIMEDVNKHGSQLDDYTSTNAKRFNSLVSDLVKKIGSVDEEMHYFRNKLNRAPKTLDDLIEFIKANPDNRWKLIDVGKSFFHMQGVDGVYNMKFISADGHNEAVYNKKGELLTADNDPVNMGTYNYCPVIEDEAGHTLYDVNPYYEYGNTKDSSQKGHNDINLKSGLAAKLYYDPIVYFNVNKHRQKILDSGVIKEVS